MNHAVLAVGYGQSSSGKYFLIRRAGGRTCFNFLDNAHVPHMRLPPPGIPGAHHGERRGTSAQPVALWQIFPFQVVGVLLF